MTHSFDEICKLDSERTQGEWYSNGDWNTEPATLGRSVPFSYVYRKAEGLLDCNIAKGVGDDHAANAQYIAAMPDAVGLLKEFKADNTKLKQLLDRAIMGLEFYADDCRYNTTTTITPQSITTHEPAILRDLGNTANETLADIRKSLGDTNG